MWCIPRANQPLQRFHSSRYHNASPEDIQSLIPSAKLPCSFTLRPVKLLQSTEEYRRHPTLRLERTIRRSSDEMGLAQDASQKSAPTVYPISPHFSTDFKTLLKRLLIRGRLSGMHVLLAVHCIGDTNS